MWRGGANEATRFTFSRDVRIEGCPVQIGTYIFYAMPAEKKGTLINQPCSPAMGCIRLYNPAFDALRLAAPSRDVPRQESLRYTIQPAGTTAAVVTIEREICRLIPGGGAPETFDSRNALQSV